MCNDLPKHPYGIPDDLREFELKCELNYEMKIDYEWFMHYFCQFDVGFKLIVTEVTGRLMWLLR